MEEQALASWTERLTGLEPERVHAARTEIEQWGFPHVANELLRPDVDSAVAATLLTEGIAKLEGHGVPRERLLKKVRQDREVWGTWAEIRAADILLRTAFPDADLRLEEGKSKGAHADLRFFFPTEKVARSVEVKAVGLSDEEAAFYGRQAPALPALLPKVGLSHGHAAMEAAAAKRPNREHRRAIERDNKKLVRRIPNYPPGLRGSVIVGHGSEEAYARRVARRIAQAARQLPPTDECWVAVYWSNGARIASVRAAVPWGEIPKHVTGFILVGCAVAFPDRQIHCFTTGFDRDAQDEIGEVISEHEEMVDLAGLILQRLDNSSAVRPTLLQVGNRRLIYRDGKRRILPFHVLMDADPETVARPGQAPLARPRA